MSLEHSWWATYDGLALTLRQWLQRVSPDPEPLILRECAPLLLEKDGLLRTTLDDHPPAIWKAKHPGGRPSRYSRKLAVDICCRWANTGGAWLKALDTFKIDKTTALRWRRRHKEFYMMFRFIQDLLRHYPDRFPPRRYRRRVVMNPKYARNSSSIRRERRRGRPSTYHPDFVFKVWPSQRQTARAIGVSKSTVAKWCKRYQEFGNVQEVCWILKCRIRTRLPDGPRRSLDNSQWFDYGPTAPT